MLSRRSAVRRQAAAQRATRTSPRRSCSSDPLRPETGISLAACHFSFDMDRSSVVPRGHLRLSQPPLCGTPRTTASSLAIGVCLHRFASRATYHLCRGSDPSPHLQERGLVALDASACCYLHDKASNRVSRSRRFTDAKRCFRMAHRWLVLQHEGRLKLRFEPRAPPESLSRAQLASTSEQIRIRQSLTISVIYPTADQMGLSSP